VKSRIDKTEYKTIKSPSGTMSWFKNGKQHRDNDKPASINSNGNMSWFKDGERHRENDKPAIIHNDGRMYWFKNGNLIRDVGNEI